MLGDIAFDSDGTVWMRTEKASVLLHPGWESYTYPPDDILVSLPSQTRRFQMIIGDIYDAEPAYVLDRKQPRLQHLPIHRYVHNDHAWSPDDAFLVVSRDYEATGQLFVVDLPDMRIREVRRAALVPREEKFCCGLSDWGNKEEVGFLVDGSIRWISKARFQFLLDVMCNPYNEQCDDEAFRKANKIAYKSYRITVDMRTGRVFEELLKTEP